MHYKNNQCIGIRRKWGKKQQIFSFGGKVAGLSEDVLRSHADACLRKLDAGDKEKAVCVWVKSVVSPSDS